ncbi:thioesterase family protein [Gordonia aurantiaca]|uniref:hypothetical protein n=1 Tax=Gordonia sp. B21 TaxID=3151852 RepID=UPI0032673906
MSTIAFFETVDDPSDGTRHLPTPFSRSAWSPDAITGPAVCGLVAWAVEEEFGSDEFLPARCTIDMFKSARRLPTSTRNRMIRSGGRIRVVDTEIVQHPDDGEEFVVARGTTVFLKTSTNPPGERWHRPAECVTFTPPERDPDGYAPLFSSDSPDGVVGDWDPTMGNHQTGTRKRLWTRAVPIVPGKEPTPFQRTVIGAESASLISNWGTTGIGLINCDLTVAISRLPHGERIGVEADFHVEDDGVSVSNTGLYDRDGMFGTALVTAVNNAAAQIDFTKVDTMKRYREG